MSEHERILRLTADLEILAAQLAGLVATVRLATDAVESIARRVTDADEHVGLMRLRLQGGADSGRAPSWIGLHEVPDA